MIRVLKVGGRALIYVWAKDQNRDQQKSSYLKQNSKKDEKPMENGVVTSPVGVTLPIHTNRTQFKHSNLLVPWKLKSKDSTTPESTFLRFYHVFEDNELIELCKRINNIEILNSYYDQGNWCVEFKKI